MIGMAKCDGDGGGSEVIFADALCPILPVDTCGN